MAWYSISLGLIHAYNTNKESRKYAIKGKKNKDVYLHAITMIHPTTDWIEICSVIEATADLVPNQIELDWLNRFHLPNKITIDRGKELLAGLKNMMTNDYGIPCDSISVRNPQANAIVEMLINKGNQKENRQRQSYVYCTGDKVLLNNAWKAKFNHYAYIGPYTVTEVQNNGTVRARRGNVTDTYDLRNITPFKE